MIIINHRSLQENPVNTLQLTQNLSGVTIVPILTILSQKLQQQKVHCQKCFRLGASVLASARGVESALIPVMEL